MHLEKIHFLCFDVKNQRKMLHFFACKERKIIFDKGLFWDNIFYSRFLINNQLIRGVVKHLKNTQKRKTREREL